MSGAWVDGCGDSTPMSLLELLAWIHGRPVVDVPIPIDVYEPAVHGLPNQLEEKS